jgi:hypothetical protein
MHLDIAAVRKLVREKYQQIPTKTVELMAWGLVKSTAEANKNSVVESTGVTHWLEQLWTPELANRGIYTIKFTAPVEVCQERARRREREPIEGYDLDECYGISLEEELHQSVPANLVVDMTSWEDYWEKFEETERYILRAKKFFEVYATAKTIGDNKLKEEQ